MLCVVRVFSHSFSISYPRLVDCIDCKCLTECQSRLEMVGLSLGVSFWFISLVIMCLMDSRSCNKFWVVETTRLQITSILVRPTFIPLGDTYVLTQYP